MGGWGGGGLLVNEKRYRTLTCFGLISAECFVSKPLALIWRLQHLELIIRRTPAALQLTAYTAITSTPIQTLYSFDAGTYIGLLPAAGLNNKKIQLNKISWNVGKFKQSINSCVQRFWSSRVRSFQTLHMENTANKKRKWRSEF